MMRSLNSIAPIGLVALVLQVLAAAPGLAEEQQRVMSVFFDQGTTEIDPAAKKILAFAKNGMKPSSRITITGHCDTSEAEPDKLSLARAIAVLNALVELGVPGGTAFTVLGRGSAVPRKKTGPGVAEPINRNAMIVIR
jgi:outer membrane protein OmpA-like peptidoglycan-associated protein